MLPQLKCATFHRSPACTTGHRPTASQTTRCLIVHISVSCDANPPCQTPLDLTSPSGVDSAGPCSANWQPTPLSLTGLRRLTGIVFPAVPGLLVPPDTHLLSSATLGLALEATVSIETPPREDHDRREKGRAERKQGPSMAAASRTHVPNSVKPTKQTNLCSMHTNTSIGHGEGRSLGTPRS